MKNRLACGVAVRSYVTALGRELRERRKFQNRRLEWCDALRFNGFQQIFEVFGGNTPYEIPKEITYILKC